MLQLQELININEPAMPIVREWVAKAVRPIELLPPSELREEVLFQTQVTTRSPMGAVTYETGGILVDHGGFAFWAPGIPG
jgi:hypothetical protein